MFDRHFFFVSVCFSLLHQTFLFRTTRKKIWFVKEKLQMAYFTPVTITIVPNQNYKKQKCCISWSSNYIYSVFKVETFFFKANCLYVATLSQKNYLHRRQ